MKTNEKKESFTLLDRLRFVTVLPEYLKELHLSDSEVFYMESAGYERKMHLGILVHNNERKYIIPFTSAKPKHKNWKKVTDTNYLIYERINRALLGKNDIFKESNNIEYVLRIMSVLEIKKMLPIKEGVYKNISFDEFHNSNTDDIRYKNLLEKEYRFCLKIKRDILERASNIYSKQLKSGIVLPFHCNFIKLEEVCDNYKVEKQNVNYSDSYIYESGKSSNDVVGESVIQYA